MALHPDGHSKVKDRFRWPMSLAFVLVAGVIAIATLPSEDETFENGDEELHIHDLVVDSTTNRVFVATHSGLFRIGRHSARTAVIDASDDVTAFAISSYGRYFAGGHPDLSQAGRFRAPDKPPLLGLIASDDGGRTWKVASLLGEADFHALVVVGSYLFAADSTSGRLLVSGDGGQVWEPRGSAELIDLAVDPRDVNRMVGVGLTKDFRQSLETSRDGGVTWREIDGPELVDVDWTLQEAFGITAAGAIWRSVDGLAWTEIGRAPGASQAIAVTESAMYVVGPEVDVSVSVDRGATWDSLKDSPT